MRASPRVATEADIPALVRVINQAYRVEAFFVDGDRTSAEDVAARLATPRSCFLVIDSSKKDELAGAVYVEVHESRGHFALLSVHPGHQRQGIGRVLVEAAEDYCRNAGCAFLDLEIVDLRTELPAFYEPLGFERIGTAPFPQPAKLNRDAYLVLMTKPLHSDSASRVQSR